MKELGTKNIHNLEFSPKLLALKQLLHDCGIGLEDIQEEEIKDKEVVTTEPSNEHRVLIFAQLTSMLDLIEEDLLKKHLPSVTYLRMDGSVPNLKRQDLVNRFNSDPTIDLLLLTTHVGGLGLNLTGADIVIFMEHDWNP